MHLEQPSEEIGSDLQVIQGDPTGVEEHNGTEEHQPITTLHTENGVVMEKNEMICKESTIDQPPCTKGETIMVETQNGFKFGKVKFVGSTEFADGEWIGIALERPSGEFVGLAGMCDSYRYCIIRQT